MHHKVRLSEMSELISIRVTVRSQLKNPCVCVRAKVYPVRVKEFTEKCVSSCQLSLQRLLLEQLDLTQSARVWGFRAAVKGHQCRPLPPQKSPP